MSDFLAIIDAGHGGPVHRKSNLGVVAGGKITLCPPSWVRIKRSCPDQEPGRSEWIEACRWAIDGDLVEKDWTLKWSQAVFALLDKESGIDVRVTRHGDYDLSLRRRGDMSIELGADLVISGHVDAIHVPTKRGGNTFWKAGCAKSRLYASVLADLIPEEVRSGRIWEAVDKPGDWRRRAAKVLRAHATSPALLQEWGYATSPDDLAYLTTDAAVAAAADATRMAVLAIAAQQHMHQRRSS